MPASNSFYLQQNDRVYNSLNVLHIPFLPLCVFVSPPLVKTATLLDIM